MKEKLLAVLVSHPAASGKSADQLDDLAEDLLSVVIRAFVAPPTADPQLAELEHRVDELRVSEFGASLHNLLHFGPAYTGKLLLDRSGRDSVTKAVLQTLALELDNQKDVRFEAEDKATLIKRRLAELSPEKVPATVN